MASTSRVQSGWSNLVRKDAVVNKPNFGGIVKDEEDELSKDITEVAANFQYMKVQPTIPVKKEIEVSILAVLRRRISN
jgi:hypothetical protein